LTTGCPYPEQGIQSGKGSSGTSPKEKFDCKIIIITGNMDSITIFDDSQTGFLLFKKSIFPRIWFQTCVHFISEKYKSEGIPQEIPRRFKFLDFLIDP
jgi:hypothetical protein